MKKALKLLAVLFCVAILLASTAIFVALNTEVNAVELTETGKWTTDGSTDSFTYNGTPYTVSTDSSYSGKYIDVNGTKWYLIANADDLAKVSGETAANFIIANDFKITTTGNTENRQSIKAATIDGCGHTITVNGTAGLFGNFTGKVTNLELTGEISSASHTSAFAQWCFGGHFNTVVNRVNVTCSSTATDFNGYNAGFVGYVHNENTTYGPYSTTHDNVSYTAVFENCYNYGSVTNEGANGGRAAGFVSAIRNGATVKFVSCVNEGVITNSKNTSNGAGGFVAVQWANGGNATFVDCTNNGNVTGKVNAGGFVGRIEGGPNATFTNCTNKGNVGGDNNCHGGFIGISNASKPTFTDCSNIGDISGNIRIGGFIGVAEGKPAEFVRCTNNCDISATGSETGGFVGTNWGSAQMTFKGCVNDGTVTTSNRAGGFVGVLWGTTSVNFTEKCENKAAVKGSAEAGGFVAYLDGAGTSSYTDAKNSGTVNGSLTGGFVGYTKGQTTFTRSTNENAITGTSHSGGFVGTSDKNITFNSSTNKGTVTVTGGFAGGFIANAWDGMSANGCVNEATGTVTNNATSGDRKAGGIVANVGLKSAQYTITNCENRAAVTSHSRTGGIVGQIAHNTWSANDGTGTITLSGCVNTGAITTQDGRVGGMVGFLESYSKGISVTIDSCVNNGTITTNGYAGGMIGETCGNITINKCVNKGTIINNHATATRQPGGIMGTVQMKNGNADAADNFTLTVTNNANYGQIKSTDASAGIIGCHSAPAIGQNWVNNANQPMSTYKATETVVVENNFNAGICSRKSDTTEEGRCGGIVNWSHLGGSNAAFKNNYTTDNGTANGYDTTLVTSAQAANGTVAYALGEAWGQTLGTDKLPAPGDDKVYKVALKAKADGDKLADSFSNTDADKIISLSNADVEKREDVTGYRVLTNINAYDYDALIAAGVEFELGTIITANKYGVSTYEELKAAGKPAIVVTTKDNICYTTGDYNNTFAGSLLNIKNPDMDYAVRGYIEIDGTIIYTDAVVVNYNKLA